MRGEIRNKLGDKKGAFEDYTQAINLNPNDAAVYYDRGVLLSESGDKKLAIEDFQNAANIYRNLGDIERYNLAQAKIKSLQRKKSWFG